MIGAGTVVMEMIFSVGMIYVSWFVLIASTLLLGFTRTRVGEFTQRFFIVTFAMSAIFGMSQLVNFLYPFHVVDRHSSCFQSDYRAGWVPRGVLHHPSAKELERITDDSRLAYIN
jgi:hypothetical protein